MISARSVQAVDSHTEGMPTRVVTGGVAGGRATRVRIRNVPSFSARTGATVDVPGRGPVTYDLAYGGNFYALVPASDVGLDVRAENVPALLEHGLALMAAVNEQDPPK